jgi:hypothetical protein
MQDLFWHFLCIVKQGGCAEFLRTLPFGGSNLVRVNFLLRLGLIIN